MNLLEVLDKHGIKHTDMSGNECGFCCPFHLDKTPSATGNFAKNVWYCHSCTEKGKASDIDKYMNNMEQSVKDEFIANQGAAIDYREAYKRPKLATHEYKNINGHTVYKVYRYAEWPKTLPVVLKEENGRKSWKGGMPDKGKGFRILYNLLAVSLTNSPVVVVEGEKAADAAIKLFNNDDQYGVPTTWVGGTNAWQYTDWSPLKDKMVILIADADKEGRKAMNSIADHLHDEYGVSQIALVLPEGETSWDVADTAWGGPQELIDWARSSMIKFERKEPTPEAEKPKEETMPDPIGEPPAHLSEPIPDEIPPEKDRQVPAVLQKPDDLKGNPLIDNPYFRMVARVAGDSGKVLFISKFRGALLDIKISRLTWSELGLLAGDAMFWNKVCGVQEDKIRPSSGQIQNLSFHMNHLSYQLPLMRPDMIAGIGVWRDGDNVVIHSGDAMHVNGTHHALPGPKGLKKVYIEQPELAYNPDEIATDKEMKEFYKSLQLYRFGKPIHGDYFMGYMVTSLLGGCLAWRPHVWLTSTAKRGKSWLIDNVVKRLMEDWLINVAGDYSVPGLQRAVGNDSRPVAIDESEAKGNPKLMSELMSAIRTASGGTGGRIRANNTSQGVVMTYPKGSFILLSITNALVNEADASRISKILLSGKTIEESRGLKFEDVAAKIESCLSEKGAERIRNRILSSGRQLIQRVYETSKYLVGEGVEARYAKQIGTLLAGASIFTHPKEGSINVDWLKDKIKEYNNLYSEKREAGANFVLEMLAADILVSGKFTRHMSVTMCINRYRECLEGVDTDLDDDLPDHAAKKDAECFRVALQQVGIIPEFKTNSILIAGNHAGLRKTMRPAGQQWQDVQIDDLMVNMNHSERVKETVYFGNVACQPVRVFLKGLSVDINKPIEEADEEESAPVTQNEDGGFSIGETQDKDEDSPQIPY